MDETETRDRLLIDRQDTRTDRHAGQSNSRRQRHLVLVGPTASGKSSVALSLAHRRRTSGENVELISMDSMAVYRGMDIGTTTPTRADRQLVPHHLVDMIDACQEFSVAEFVDAVRVVLTDLESRDGRAILVGGTGLYVQAVVDDLALPGRFPETAAAVESEPDTGVLYERLMALDPEAAARIGRHNRRRVVRALEVTEGSGRRFSSFGPGLDVYPNTPFVLAGLRVDRSVLATLIHERVEAQIAGGFIDEVEHLRASTTMSRTASQALGYGELATYLDGGCSLDEAVAMIEQRSRRFAVRQIRWFRRDPRITWLDHDGDPMVVLDALDELWAHADRDR